MKNKVTTKLVTVELGTCCGGLCVTFRNDAGTAIDKLTATLPDRYWSASDSTREKMKAPIYCATVFELFIVYRKTQRELGNRISEEQIMEAYIEWYDAQFTPELPFKEAVTELPRKHRASKKNNSQAVTYEPRSGMCVEDQVLQ